MKERNISIPSTIENRYMVECFIEYFIASFNLSSKLFGRISMSVIEAFGNAVLHGNKQNITKEVVIVATRTDNQLKINVSDKGKGFDYTIIPDPTLPYPINTSKQGLFLMKELSDDLIFENNGASVTLIFNLE